MPKFKVQVTRTITQTADVIVEADNAQEAIEQAADVGYGDASKWNWVEDDNHWQRGDYYTNAERDDVEEVPEQTGTLYDVVVLQTESSTVRFQMRADNEEILRDKLNENPWPDEATYALDDCCLPGAAEMTAAERTRHEAKLRDGTIVLGKLTQYGVVAKQYTNRTQAQKAATREQGDVIQRGVPFYVRLRAAGVK